MRKTYGLLAIGVLAATGLLACGETKPPEPAVDPQAVMKAEGARLVAVLDTQVGEGLAQSPERATQLGRKSNYDKLNDISEAQQDRALEWRRTSVAAMKSRFDRAKLDQDAQANYDIWAFELERAEKAMKFRRHGYVFG